MRTPTSALLWEIWQRQRAAIIAIAALTVAGRLIDGADMTGPAADEASAVTMLCGMMAFLLLFGVFNYTDSESNAGLGRFPHRLFTLPVSSLRLVAVPVLAGIVAVEILYLAWSDPFSRGGSTSRIFVAVLFGAAMVLYLAVLWTCARAGALRLVIMGMIAAALFAVGLLPSFPPTPAPAWRSEGVLAVLVAGLSLAAFVLTWTHVAGSRAGGGRATFRLDPLMDRVSNLYPSRRKPFATAAGAHFWHEWRTSGTALPLLVAGVVLFVIAPTAWLASGDPRYTLWLLIGALATPIVLALPVGIAFSKPTFWFEDLAVPAFAAVRPLSAQDFVAIKVMVAAASAAASWAVVLVFLAVWLPSWATLDLVSWLGARFVTEYPAAAGYGLAVLVLIGGMFLTWRSLVSHLWTGLSGIRRLFLASAFSLIALVTSTLLGVGPLNWLLSDPARFGLFVRLVVVAFVVKCALAAYAWRGVSGRYVRGYILVWFAGTASLLTLSLAASELVRMYVPFDLERLRIASILLAMLAVPLARVGLAPSLFARNRHQ